jgi:hypothetical protein
LDKRQANEAAAAPAKPMPLCGKVYAISQPNLAVMAAIGSLARKNCEWDSPLGSLVNDPAWKELSAEAQLQCAREAARAQTSGQRTVDQFDLADQLLKPDVLAFAVWACARPNHPDLALPEIRNAITEDNAPEVFILFSEASGMLSLGESAGASGSPASGAPATSSSKVAGSPSAA